MATQEQVRELAGKVADLLEETYVPYHPIREDENCAVTAVMSIAPFVTGAGRARTELFRELSKRAKAGLGAWSDTSGKEVVVQTFRDIAEGR